MNKPLIEILERTLESLHTPMNAELLHATYRTLHDDLKHWAVNHLGDQTEFDFPLPMSLSREEVAELIGADQAEALTTGTMAELASDMANSLNDLYTITLNALLENNLAFKPSHQCAHHSACRAEQEEYGTPVQYGGIVAEETTVLCHRTQQLQTHAAFIVWQGRACEACLSEIEATMNDLIGGWLRVNDEDRIGTDADWKLVARYHDHRPTLRFDGLEMCAECGQSVAPGTGKFVNRVPLDDLTTRLENGYHFPQGAFCCADCNEMINALINREDENKQETIAA